MSWLVTTDMDGTLLNHDDYRWQAAKPCLEYLQRQGIPVILNTSKTFLEVAQWVKNLAIEHPFIVENGSAIYCPSGYFSAAVFKNNEWHVRHENGYDIIQLGQSLDALLEFKNHYAKDLESLVECSLSRAIELTGLCETEAKASQQRYFTLPLVINKNFSLDELTQQAQAAKMQILSGGRFAHLMGICDKGKAIQIFQHLYQLKINKPSKLIALGDSDNDRAMLAIADQAIIVRNHKNNWLEMAGDTIYRTEQQAPEGWVEGITTVLATDYESIKELI